MGAVQTALHSTKPHFHTMGDECPYCEQPIPNDRLEEISARIQAKDRLRQSEADAKASAELEAFRAQSQTAIEQLRSDAATREATALAQGKKLAEAALQARLTEAAEATRAVTERAANLEAEIARSKTTLAATVEKMTAEFASREEAAKLEARSAVAQELSVKVAEAHTGKVEAEKKAAAAEIGKAAAEKKVVELQASQEEAINARVVEVREAMENAKTEAVNSERSKNFEEKLKLEGLVADLQRKLQNKTAEELGEGAEVQLFELLKAEFPHDEITRVGRGNAGADIVHKVRHNGATCGCIVYDSKNHQQFRSDHVTKLRQDQIAAKADHAVLSTAAFPKDKKQLHIDNGVILANPARAVVIAMLLRQQVVQLHCLKVSNDERTSKIDELYAMMTSDRFSQFMSAITRSAEQLEVLQVQEKKAHDSNWKKQGELFRTIIRTCAQFDEEIGRIIGTAPATT
ncbi:MAG: DUF2130 domain-containing protein [Hyphomicrobium sp.]|jgi:hypothetical protein|uniref:DUF2130 domain-containing protein n=1 Tax=Hyphomicrobium sp. TaxID=82 RepID=UPI0025BD5EF1|nr:DUF2130 domain-containing protein [Hyphomicrobium sp.]MBX9865109.1 DUF2130 domain-containing protein [Hyphomicrobium sp.]